MCVYVSVLSLGVDSGHYVYLKTDFLQVALSGCSTCTRLLLAAWLMHFSHVEV